MPPCQPFLQQASKAEAWSERYQKRCSWLEYPGLSFANVAVMPAVYHAVMLTGSALQQALTLGRVLTRHGLWFATHCFGKFCSFRGRRAVWEICVLCCCI